MANSHDDITHDQPRRLELTIAHDGTVELSSCDECAGTTKEVARMLIRVAETVLSHPEGLTEPYEVRGI